jgi:hypothetical protein
MIALHRAKLADSVTVERSTSGETYILSAPYTSWVVVTRDFPTTEDRLRFVRDSQNWDN